MLASAVSLLNPSVIVIGGLMVEGGESLLAGVREVVYARSLPLATGQLRIVASTAGPMAGVLGAAILVVEDLLSAEQVDSRLSGVAAPSRSGLAGLRRAGAPRLRAAGARGPRATTRA